MGRWLFGFKVFYEQWLDYLQLCGIVQCLWQYLGDVVQCIGFWCDWFDWFFFFDCGYDCVGYFVWFVVVQCKYFVDLFLLVVDFFFVGFGCVEIGGSDDVGVNDIGVDGGQFDIGGIEFGL